MKGVHRLPSTVYISMAQVKKHQKQERSILQINKVQATSNQRTIRAIQLATVP